MPHLAAAELEQIGTGAATPGRAVGVIGAGTGLGVSALIPGKTGWTALPTEGGHVSFAPGNPREDGVLATLRNRLGHVSNERLLPARACSTWRRRWPRSTGGACAADSPAAVTEAARARQLPILREAVPLFSSLLGAAAGDLALTIGARGGVYVAGGVCARLGPLFDRAAFRHRFADKGRMRQFLEPIPTWLVLRTDTGLLGAAHYRIDS